MWLAAVAEGSGSDNPYSLLITIASVIGTIAVAWMARTRRRRPDIDPDPVTDAVTSAVEQFMRRRIRQLERQVVDLERQIADERRKGHDKNNQILQLSIELASCKAELAALRAARGGAS